MEAHHIEHLLFQEESASLIFRERAFPFHGVSDEEKCEILSTILGMANAWRTSAGYLVIGVRPVPGGRAVPVGVDPNFPFHRIPRLFNQMTNRPLEFSHTGLEVEGKHVDVIHVPVQRRPIYLTQDFGTLREGAVYVHRGSMITEAGPEEIATMGFTSQITAPAKPALEIEFADIERERGLGWQLGLVSEICPQLREVETQIRRGELPALPGVGAGDFALEQQRQLTLVQQVWNERILNHVGFVVRGMGGATVHGAKLELAFRDDPSLVVLDERTAPRLAEPGDRGILGVPSMELRPSVRVDRSQGWISVTADLGNIQPRATRWVRDCLIIGAMEDTKVQVRGQVTADNLEEPLPVEGLIEIFSQQSTASVTELLGEGE